MGGFVAGLDRGQATLLPECLEDWVDENNSVRAVDVFVEALDLRDLGFEGVDAAGCSATIWMRTQRQSGWPFWRSRREDDCRGPAITQAIFS